MPNTDTDLIERADDESLQSEHSELPMHALVCSLPLSHLYPLSKQDRGYTCLIENWNNLL